MADIYSNKPQLGMMVKKKAFDYGISKPEIPVFIVENIRYNLWQEEAEKNQINGITI